MKNYKLSYLNSLAVVLMFCGLSFGQNQESQVIKPLNTFTSKDVLIKLVYNKKRMSGNKAVSLGITVTNKNREQTIIRYFDFPITGFKLEIKDSKGKIIPSTKNPDNSWQFKHYRTEMPPLYPVERVKVDLTKYFDLPAGRYSIRATGNFFSYVQNAQKPMVNILVTSDWEKFIIINNSASKALL